MVTKNERNRGYDAVIQEGLSEGVAVGQDKVGFSGHRHGPFDDDIRAMLEGLRVTLAEVYPLSLDQWEDGFRRDAEPAREIALWLDLAGTYRRLVEEVFQHLESEHRAAIFRVLLAALTSEEAALETARGMGIPPNFTARILQERRRH